MGQLIRISRQKLLYSTAILFGVLLLGVVFQLTSHKASAATVSSTTPCVAASTPAKWNHVVVLMFENKTYGQVVGSTSAPYVSSLAKQCGTYNNWKDANYNVTGTTNGSYNSKPNYATLTSGVPPTVHGLKDDTYTTTTSVDNIYNELRLANKNGKDYYSALATATPCAASNFSGAYHDAIRYFTDLGSAYCNSHDVPLSTFMTDVNSGTLPEFSMILPTNSENMHDNSISSGDSWAKNFLTPLFDSAQYKSGDTAVFFLWDEDAPIPNVLAAPSIAPASTVPVPSGNPINHYSATRTWEEMLGLPLIGNTGSASSLLSFFNGTGATTPPPTDNPPAVSLTAPTNGTTLTTSPISITANATDDHGVSKVDFYDGTTLLGSDTTSPYSFSWNTSSLSGAHTLSAKAYDTAGHVTTSASVAVTVSIPVVSTCPVDSSHPIGTATQVVSVSTDSVYHVWSRVMAPDTINNSYFLQIDGGCAIVVGDTATPANTWTWLDTQSGDTANHTSVTLKAGSHTLTLMGREAGMRLDRVLLLAGTCTPTGTGDNCADTTPPTGVAVTAPTASQTVKGNVQMTATASDNGQSGIAKVDFYIDDKLVGSSTTSPYQFTWNSASVADGTHTAKVIATDVAGNSTTSANVVFSVSNADTTAPSAPANLTATKVLYNEVDLQWSASTDNIAVTGYNVLRNGVVVNTAPVTTTTFKDTAVTANTSYSYTVVALDVAGNHSSPSNAVALATPQSPDTTAPSVPGSFTAAATSSTSASLSWAASTDNTGVAGYRVLRGSTVIATTTALSYIDTTVLPGTSYTYSVVAYDAAGNASAPSTARTVVTPALPDTTAPSAPSFLVGSPTSSQVNLNWTASSDNVGISGYRIYRNSAAIGTATSASFADATVSAGQTYTYYVTAYDAAGNVSSASNQVSVTVPATTTVSHLYIGNTDDTTILKSQPTRTHGNDTTMSVDGSPVKDMLLKFKVTGINGRIVTSTKLRLWATNPAGPTGGSFHAVTNNNWSQATATWNNAPSASSTILDSLGAVKSGAYYYVDVTDFIRADGTYSLRVKSTAADGAAYATKEASTVSQRPQLSITVQ